MDITRDCSHECLLSHRSRPRGQYVYSSSSSCLPASADPSTSTATRCSWTVPTFPIIAQASQTFTLNHYIPAVDPILMSAADLGARHQIGAPIHVYPLYENGFRAHRGQSVEENHAESTSMYAEFAKIAAENEVAWNYGHVESEETIGRVEGKNRMICFPCTWPLRYYEWSPRVIADQVESDPLLMNAFNTVNLAAAVLLTSTENAAKLGIPKDRWIYPLAGAGTQDSPNCKSTSTLRCTSCSMVQILTRSSLSSQSGNVRTSTPAHRSPDRSTPPWTWLV